MVENILDARGSIKEALAWVDQAIDWLTPGDAPGGVIYPDTYHRLFEIKERLEKVECDQFKRDCDREDKEQSDMEDRADATSY